jgi:putative NADH-flavin reductase
LAQNKEIRKTPERKNSGDKALLVKSDAAELEAKKKAAAEEKAKLPKPYNPKADAQADINKLVAKAKKKGKIL